MRFTGSSKRADTLLQAAASSRADFNAAKARICLQCFLSGPGGELVLLPRVSVPRFYSPAMVALAVGRRRLPRERLRYVSVWTPGRGRLALPNTEPFGDAPIDGSWIELAPAFEAEQYTTSGSALAEDPTSKPQPSLESAGQ